MWTGWLCEGWDAIGSQLGDRRGLKRSSRGDGRTDRSSSVRTSKEKWNGSLVSSLAATYKFAHYPLAWNLRRGGTSIDEGEKEDRVDVSSEVEFLFPAGRICRWPRDETSISRISHSRNNSGMQSRCPICWCLLRHHCWPTKPNCDDRHTPTQDMVADLLTKPLQGQQFTRLGSMLLNGWTPLSPPLCKPTPHTPHLAM